MSLQAMEWARTIRVGDPAAKAVLTQLADRHNRDERSAWPSVPRLAWDTEMDERTVRRKLRQLEAQRLIRTLPPRAGRRQNTYVLAMDDPERTPGTVPPMADGTPGTVPPDPGQAAPPTPGTVPPELEVEQEENGSRARAPDGAAAPHPPPELSDDERRCADDARAAARAQLPWVHTPDEEGTDDGDR